MNNVQTGNLIRNLRAEAGMTQEVLADKLGVSKQAVSKWERGAGCPDVAFFPALSELFAVNVEELMSGEIKKCAPLSGSLKNVKFSVCPHCGSIVLNSGNAVSYCCGKRMNSIKPDKATDNQRLSVEPVENELFISSSRPMTKEDYVSFVALVSADGVIIKKCFPEWDLQLRLPRILSATLYFYSVTDGLKFQYLKP